MKNDDETLVESIKKILIGGKNEMTDLNEFRITKPSKIDSDMYNEVIEKNVDRNGKELLWVNGEIDPSTFVAHVDEKGNKLIYISKKSNEVTINFVGKSILDGISYQGVVLNTSEAKAIKAAFQKFV